MVNRPSVIAFDVIETLFPLEPLRQRIIDAGQPGHVLELWFSRLLRDAFVLVASGGYRPFPDIATHGLAAVTGGALSDDAVRHIVAGFAELDPHPDVEPAMRLAHDAGVEVITLTNGSVKNTSALLSRAGVDAYVQRVLSVDDIQRWKPAPDIYLHAARTCGVPPERVALVAAHSWDTHGAHHAGLVTGWVSRLEKRFPDIYSPADVTGDDLVAVVEGLLALPEGGSP
ncbi:MAG: haloacid dehalogenase type II [Propionibacteriales bacterium]|nr:haloacid dehalogenase type II [Propionibacteriales bacterium]